MASSNNCRSSIFKSISGEITSKVIILSVILYVNEEQTPNLDK
jgi:hypothetical protein